MLHDVQAIFFDWGGTLVSVDRQIRSWVEGAEYATRQLFAAGMPAPDTAIQDLLTCFEEIQQRTYAKRGLREIDFNKIVYAWFKKLRMTRPSPAMLTTVSDLFWQPWTESLDLYEGAAQVVGQLADRGYALVLVSNTEAPPAHAEQQLERLGLVNHFRGAVYSSAIGRRKPHKSVYAAAITVLSQAGQPAVPGSILFVGDSPECDVIAPMKLGMRAVLIRNSSTERHVPPEQYAPAKPELTIGNVHELLEHLPAR